MNIIQALLSPVEGPEAGFIEAINAVQYNMLFIQAISDLQQLLSRTVQSSYTLWRRCKYEAPDVL